MTRQLGCSRVAPIGLGCMSLSHAYGSPPPRAAAIRLLNQALDLGYDHFDTATLYGDGQNETLIGEAIGHRRDAFFLASKCGMGMVDGKRVIDGRPATLRAQIDASLKRLGTDRIDLYYLHRWDRSVPIEDSVGALGEMVRAGKVLAIGLSEVSAPTLRRAHAVHPIAAVQSEYSLWSRNAELGILDTTRELGTALVAFSPVARGFLAGGIDSPDTLEPGDIRRAMPRFEAGNFARNLNLLSKFRAIAAGLDRTPAHLCLGWLLARGEHVLPIPGTTSPAHLAENAATPPSPLAAEVVAELDRLFDPAAIAGPRYPAATQAEIDTEQF
ncbi:aldo/keto reductase [Sphingomonas sp.]|uniref:aldo/keto reductase n=1 Tax=Sphingomonas sp. TaxID=28214 RepID=UPI001EB2476A|nr:aldo/keto reductase [Sphingomonas sp.]MBX3592887.1 aldo/keto reductase [Sphingomonas sp.]